MQILGDIALFVEVVHTKSFRLAAEHLDMPASTLSRRITLLEKSIGLRLLNRTTRRVDVTDAGAAYYARCAHLLDEARIAHEELMDNAINARGTLRLSCTHDFANRYLPSVLSEFAQAHPAVSIDLDLSTRRVDLIAENLDAVIRLGHLPDSGLIAHKLGELQSALYASAAYLASAPPLLTPKDLSQHRCIRMNNKENGSTWALYADGTHVPVETKVQGRFTVAGMSVARQLCRLGHGVSVLDEHIAATDLAEGHLLRVLPHWRLAPTPVNLLTPSRLMPARVRLFCDFLSARFQR